jgi:hypothetical protein
VLIYVRAFTASHAAASMSFRLLCLPRDLAPHPAAYAFAIARASPPQRRRWRGVDYVRDARRPIPFSRRYFGLPCFDNAITLFFDISSCSMIVR